MNTLEQINGFLDKSKTIAISGVSRKKEKFSSALFLDLQKKGFNVVPVNPYSETLFDQKCYNSITELPDDIDRLIICTNKAQTAKSLQEAIDKNIDKIWIQNHSQTSEALKIAKDNNKDVIAKQCVFMFANGEGIHGFHKKVKSLFGTLPK